MLRIGTISRIVAGLLLLGATASISGESALDIRQLMTPAEFGAAGLAKLDAAEIQALNGWVLRYTVRDASQLREHNETVRQEIRRGDSAALRSRVIGGFRGWSGETVFRLEDGQVWQQRLPGNYFYRADSPEVELRQNPLGFWEMRVVATDRAVGVKRIN